MHNERKFHRIQMSAKATVRYLDNCHEGILGALSPGGAEINFNGSAMIPEGDECIISIILDETQPPLQMNARITNSSIYRIGVAFINMDEDKNKLLNCSLNKISNNLMTQHDENQLFISLYQQDSEK